MHDSTNISVQQSNTKEKSLKMYSFSRERKSNKIHKKLKTRTKSGGQIIE